MFLWYTLKLKIKDVKGGRGRSDGMLQRPNEMLGNVFEKQKVHVNGKLYKLKIGARMEFLSTDTLLIDDSEIACNPT